MATTTKRPSTAKPRAAKAYEPASLSRVTSKDGVFLGYIAPASTNEPKVKKEWPMYGDEIEAQLRARRKYYEVTLCGGLWQCTCDGFMQWGKVECSHIRAACELEEIRNKAAEVVATPEQSEALTQLTMLVLSIPAGPAVVAVAGPDKARSNNVSGPDTAMPTAPPPRDTAPLVKAKSDEERRETAPLNGNRSFSLLKQPLQRSA